MLVELLREPTIGGGPLATINLAKALVEKGHDVMLLLGTGPEKRIAAWIDDDISSNIKYSPGYTNIFNFMSTVNVASQLIRRVSSEYDVINANGISGLAIPEKATSKLVVTIHGHALYRGVHIFSSTILNKTLWTGQSLFDSVRIMTGGILHGFYEKKACKRARKIFSPSFFDKQKISSIYGINKEKVHRVPNLVSIPEIYPDYVRNTNADNNLLFVGSLSTLKGVPLLVKAAHHIFKENPDVKLSIAGDGALKWMVLRLMKRHPNRVLYHGVLSREKLSYLYTNSGLFLHTSLYESYGLSISEALYKGIPVVAFDTSAIPELVINGITGVLAKPFDAIDFAEKVLCLLKNPDERMRLCRNGKTFMENQADSNTIISTLETHFYEVS